MTCKVNKCVFLLLGIFLLTLGCSGGSGGQGSGGGSGASIELSSSSSQLAYGESILISATVRNSDGALAPDETSVQFTSSSGSLAETSVDTKNGVATVRFTAPSSGPGSVTIHASALGAHASLNIQLF